MKRLLGKMRSHDKALSAMYGRNNHGDQRGPVPPNFLNSGTTPRPTFDNERKLINAISKFT